MNRLVVSTQVKNISQNGNLPQIGDDNKTYLKPPPRKWIDYGHPLSSPGFSYAPTYSHYHSLYSSLDFRDYSPPWSLNSPFMGSYFLGDRYPLIPMDLFQLYKNKYIPGTKWGPLFWRPSFGGFKMFKPQNRGQTGSRYTSCWFQPSIEKY